MFSAVKNISGVLGLQILVQSHKKPFHCDQRIESFLAEMEVNCSDASEKLNIAKICWSFQKFLEGLSEKEFHTHVEALAVKRLEKPKTIMQQASKYWMEIYIRQYNFNRDKVEVEELRKLTKNDLIQFMKVSILLCISSSVPFRRQ